MLPSSTLAAAGGSLASWKPTETLSYKLPRNSQQMAAQRAADADKYFQDLGASCQTSLHYHNLSFALTGEKKPEPTECPVDMSGLSQEMAVRL